MKHEFRNEFKMDALGRSGKIGRRCVLAETIPKLVEHICGVQLGRVQVVSAYDLLDKIDGPGI